MRNLLDVYDHAIKTGGATFHLEKGVPPERGYMVATIRASEQIVSALTRQRVAEFIKRNAGHLVAENNYLGLWRNPENGWWYLDVVSHFEDREEAMRQAQVSRQLAFYDLENKCDIIVK